MQKKLTVVFPIFFDDKINNFLVMMGKFAEGKRLAGIRNGYGGKCEEGEDILDCATRELKEETGLDINSDKLIFVGDLLERDKKVFFYIFLAKEKFVLGDNAEFVDNRWFVFDDYEKYISEMLPNNGLMPSLFQILGKIHNQEQWAPFSFDFTDSKDLQRLTQNIFDN